MKMMLEMWIVNPCPTKFTLDKSEFLDFVRKLSNSKYFRDCFFLEGRRLWTCFFVESDSESGRYGT